MGKKKEVLKYDLELNLIEKYDSAREAALSNDVSENKITKCCTGKQKQINGFIYQYSGNITNEVKINIDLPVKCPYCEITFSTYNGLCKHVITNKKHGNISKEKLLADYQYNGIRPTCKCGCGQLTDVSYYGKAHFNEYIKGHYSRIHNNWGHNESAKEKSSNTRREQYKSGERIQWNKGKKWIETYSEEKISKLMEQYDNLERNNKIRNKLKGVKKSEEHAEKCRINGSCEASRKKISDKLLKRIRNKEFSLSSKLEENFIENFIKPLNLDFSTQFYIKDIQQYCDIYIPKYNLIIECDGDFWHVNPKKFPEGAKYDYQKKKIEKDKIKNEYLLNNGYKLLRIWEDDILHNEEFIKDMIQKNINNMC